jgi:hypothetical protein
MLGALLRACAQTPTRAIPFQIPERDLVACTVPTPRTPAEKKVCREWGLLAGESPQKTTRKDPSDPATASVQQPGHALVTRSE